jgi:hypothetical protein
MKVVLILVIGCLALGFAAAPQASAQYPIYVPQGYGQVVHQHGHHSHHYRPPQTQYYSGFQYAPCLGYSPLYGAG